MKLTKVKNILLKTLKNFISSKSFHFIYFSFSFHFMIHMIYVNEIFSLIQNKVLIFRSDNPPGSFNHLQIYLNNLIK